MAQQSSPCRFLLWVQLVQGAVDTHGDVQVVQSSILADFVHHSRHPGAAYLSGAPGHRAAHFLDDDAVVTGAVESQLLQDGPDLQQRQTIAGEQQRGQRSANSSTVFGSVSAV